MDEIVRKSQSCSGVKIGDFTVERLSFEDDLVLLDSTQNSLLQALDMFSDACSVAGMKRRTTKPEAKCLSRQLNFPSWWSTTETIGEIQECRGLIQK